MTHSGNSITSAFYAAQELDRLAAAYPAFRLSRETVGRHGDCWVARRKDGRRPGLHTVITADLAELHAALASPDCTGSVEQEEAAERADPGTG